LRLERSEASVYTDRPPIYSNVLLPRRAFYFCLACYRSFARAKLASDDISVNLCAAEIMAWRRLWN